jgi:hypothetical protein
MAKKLQKTLMIINIIKKNIPSFFLIFLGLPMLLGALVAFQSFPRPKPQIKTKVHKNFQIQADTPALYKHTETKYNIHGEIIQHAEYTENNKGVSTLKELKIFKYNIEGLYIGELIYDHNNALVFSEENTYNDYDQIIKITQESYSDTPLTSYTLISYDDNDNVELSQSFDHRNVQISEQKRSYTSEGELLSAIDWVYIYRNSKPVKKILSIDNHYNFQGEITQSTMLSQEGKSRNKDVKLFKNSAISDWSKYENGRLISHFKHSKLDTNSSYKQYELPPPIPEQIIPLEYDDSKRDPLENIPHKPFKTVSFKKNKQDLLTKKVTREYNQVIEVIYYLYNEQQQLVKEKIYDKISRDIEEIQYEYDQHKNTTKKTIFFNNLLVQQHHFSYEYYRKR